MAPDVSAGVIPTRPTDEWVSGMVRMASEAYALDVSYAVAMIKSARLILINRTMWTVRNELRQAEKDARTDCLQAQPRFLCMNKSPCGTGSCKFARGDLVELDVPDCSGPTVRPQMSRGTSYSIEFAVKPLLELRGLGSG